MDEKKMISAEQMDEIIEERFPGYGVVDYYGQELIVSRLVPFEVFSGIVRKVIDACFSEGTGEYLPENKEFALRMCVVEMYTNVRMPKDVEKLYGILYGTDLYEKVLGEISGYQYEAMIDAIDAGIEARNNANRRLFEHELQEAMEQFAQIGQSVQELFSSISPESVRKMVDAIGEHGIDEEKLVQAVVAEQNRIRGEGAEAEVIRFPAAESEPNGE